MLTLGGPYAEVVTGLGEGLSEAGWVEGRQFVLKVFDGKGNLKSIERSGVTRYFVEANNGRRLGAASYRIGAFLDGKKEINKELNLVYSAAVTDPERSETFADASAAGTAATAGAVGAATGAASTS